MVLVQPETIAAYTAKGWWGQQTLWDLFVQQVSARGDAEAVVDACNRSDFAHGVQRRLSWHQLAEDIDKFSLVLLQQGLRRDDIVVVHLPNCVEQYVVYLACARLGLIVTPVPAQYREHELAHILTITAATAAITFTHIGHIGRIGHSHQAADMYRALGTAHASPSKVLAWGTDVPAGVVSIEAAWPEALTAEHHAQLAQAERDAAVTANDVFSICWTSGTEAAPKGVPRSHNEWLIVPPSIIEAGQLEPGARLLNPFPLVNMSGLSSALATWLVLGGTVVQHQPFSLSVFLQQLREERIDYTVAAPAILNMLLQDNRLLAGIDFQRLKRIGSGSAPLSEWMVSGFAERHGVQIVNYFGSNEGAALSGGDIDIPDPAMRAQYFPRVGVPGLTWSVSTTRKIKTRLVDLSSGADITEAGQPGELRFQGPTVFSGYFKAPDLTKRAFDEQGFYRTGDLFEIAGDQLQYYRYVGRSKDLVIRGGMNISSEEIEGLLAACPGVQEVAVVGVPDRILGEKLCACVVSAAGQAVSLVDLVQFLRDQKRVAAYKLPEYVLQIDALPRNPVGKILKRELREQARTLAPETV
jgi:acyl-CoA synthetase (AMP-forming)/AMP-acid ligase II